MNDLISHRTFNIWARWRSPDSTSICFRKASHSISHRTINVRVIDALLMSLLFFISHRTDNVGIRWRSPDIPSLFRRTIFINHRTFNIVDVLLIISLFASIQVHKILVDAFTIRSFFVLSPQLHFLWHSGGSEHCFDPLVFIVLYIEHCDFGIELVWWW